MAQTQPFLSFREPDEVMDRHELLDYVECIRIGERIRVAVAARRARSYVPSIGNGESARNMTSERRR